MKYSLEVSVSLDRKFLKLAKRNGKQLEMIDKKIGQILESPYHFKPLRGDMHGARRVHVGKSFVLVYEIVEKQKKVRILDYDHHDNIYRQ